MKAVDKAYILLFGPRGAIVEESESYMDSEKGSLPVRDTKIVGRGIEGPDPTGKDAEAIANELRAFHAQNARDLADIYHGLLTALADNGVSADGIERILYDRIAANSTLSSDEPFDEPRPYELAFERRVKAHEQRIDAKERN